jgi:hypothetical protein
MKATHQVKTWRVAVYYVERCYRNVLECLVPVEGKRVAGVLVNRCAGEDLLIIVGRELKNAPPLPLFHFYDLTARQK